MQLLFFFINKNIFQSTLEKLKEHVYSALASTLWIRASNQSFTGKNLSFPGSPLHFVISVNQKNKKYFSYFLFYQLNCQSRLTDCLELISLLKNSTLDKVIVFSVKSKLLLFPVSEGVTVLSSISEPSEFKADNILVIPSEHQLLQAEY